MKTLLRLERFDKNGLLLEEREQVSKSYTLEFMRVLHAQHSGAGIGDASGTLRLASPPGYVPYVSDMPYSQGQRTGIVVGEGTGAVSPLDTMLFQLIGHGKRFKGVPAQFANGGFETGDFTGWALTGTPTIEGGCFTGSAGAYYAQMTSEAISQDMDLTNVVAIAFVLYVHAAAAGSYLRVWVDADNVYTAVISGYEGIYYSAYQPISYAGVHTVKFEGSGSGHCYIDNIETIGKELEYGGSEVVEPAFSAPNGVLKLRRYMNNNSGSTITVNEAGAIAYPSRLILHDSVAPGIDVANGEVLGVVYSVEITT